MRGAAPGRSTTLPGVNGQQNIELMSCWKKETEDTELGGDKMVGWTWEELEGIGVNMTKTLREILFKKLSVVGETEKR